MATQTISKQRDLTVRSFNLHGLNQGESLLKHWCITQDFDILLLQEHWLSPPNLHRIDDITGTNYTCYSYSSMAIECSSDILRGRPYGGLSIVVRNCSELITGKLVYSSDRVLAVNLAGLLIINVYFPCSSKSDYKDVTLELLGNLEHLFDSQQFDGVILSGDLNCNIDVSSWSSSVILDFMTNHNLVNCECSWPDDSRITYHHDSLQLFSCIDYFIVSVLRNMSLLHTLTIAL